MNYYASSIFIIHFNASQTFTNCGLVEILCYDFISQTLNVAIVTIRKSQSMPV